MKTSILRPLILASGLLVFSAASLGSSRSSAQELVFVPIVAALAEVRPLPGGGVDYRAWQSHVYVRNFSEESALYKTVDYFADECGVPTRLAPGQSTSICLSSRSPVDFLALEADPRAVLSAEMLRKSSRSGCGPLPEIVVLGRVPLPVFRGLFPAGSLTVTNHIDLGQIHLTPSCSTLPQELHRRRVNLTLANGGRETALFVVKFFPLNGAREMETRTYDVPPRRVTQFNGIQPMSSGIEGAEGNNELLWISVTADQPFVGYASSIFSDGGRDTMPLEVFPLRLAE